MVYTDTPRADVFLTKEARAALVKNAKKDTQNLLPAMQEQKPDFDFNYGNLQYFQEKFDNLKKENPQVKTQYDFKTAGSPFQDILIQALIWFGIMAVIYYFLFRKMGSGGGPGGQIFSIGKSRAKLFDENEKVQVTFKDVAGLEGAKEEVQEVVDFLKNSEKYTKLGGKIRFVPRQKTHKDVAKVMNTIDCGVFPVRAEGWNLELLEVLSCGKNVITSNYSGHMEYCNNENSMLFEIKELEQAFDGMWNQGQGFWGRLTEKQQEQIVKHMRETHNKKQNNLLGKNQNGIQTAINFSWDATADKMCKIIWGQI